MPKPCKSKNVCFSTVYKFDIKYGINVNLSSSSAESDIVNVIIN